MHSLFLLLSLSTALSKESLRFQYCQEQGFDTSCGMSVAATALVHYWSVPVSEAELIDLVLLDKMADGNYTVSLADIARCFAEYGIQSKAFRADWMQIRDMISKGYAPLVAHYVNPSKHFVLILGFDGDAIISADPAAGLVRLSRSQFEDRYSGAVMALASREKSVNYDTLNAALDDTQQRNRLLEAAARECSSRW